jgi:hypothetical protein
VDDLVVLHVASDSRYRRWRQGSLSTQTLCAADHWMRYVEERVHLAAKEQGDEVGPGLTRQTRARFVAN